MITSSDDDTEFIKEEGQTKYSLVKEEIIPSQSRMDSTYDDNASPVPNEMTQNSNHEIPQDLKPSSASSLSLQAINGESHEYDDIKSNSEYVENKEKEHPLNEHNLYEVNNNVVPAIMDELDYPVDVENEGVIGINDQVSKNADEDTPNVMKTETLAQNVIKDTIENDNDSDMERNDTEKVMQAVIDDAPANVDENNGGKQDHECKNLNSVHDNYSTTSPTNGPTENKADSMLLAHIGVGDDHSDPMYGTLAPMGASGDQIRATEESLEVEFDSNNVANTEGDETNKHDKEETDNTDVDRSNLPNPASKPNSVPSTRPQSGTKSRLSVRSNAASRASSTKSSTHIGVGDNHIDPMFGTLAPMGAFGDQITATEESLEVEFDSHDVANADGEETNEEAQEETDNEDVDRNDSPNPASKPNSIPSTRPQSGAKSSLSVRSNAASRASSKKSSTHSEQRNSSPENAQNVEGRESTSHSHKETSSRRTSQTNDGSKPASISPSPSRGSRKFSLKSTASRKNSEVDLDRNGGTRTVSKNSENSGGNVPTGDSTPRVLSRTYADVAAPPKSENGTISPSAERQDPVLENDDEKSSEHATEDNSDDKEEVERATTSRAGSMATSVNGVSSRKSSLSKHGTNETDTAKTPTASRKSSAKSDTELSEKQTVDEEQEKGDIEKGESNLSTINSAAESILGISNGSKDTVKDSSTIENDKEENENEVEEEESAQETKSENGTVATAAAGAAAAAAGTAVMSAMVYKKGSYNNKIRLLFIKCKYLIYLHRNDLN